MLRIPTAPETPLYEQRVRIDDRDYVFLFDYSQREDRWYLTVSLEDGTVLVRGWKLVTGVGLGPRVAHRDMFTGILVVQTFTVDQSAPGWGELGDNRRCQLIYIPRDEIVETETEMVAEFYSAEEPL